MTGLLIERGCNASWIAERERAARPERSGVRRIALQRQANLSAQDQCIAGALKENRLIPSFVVRTYSSSTIVAAESPIELPLPEPSDSDYSPSEFHLSLLSR